MDALDPTRERFLAAIAERVARDAIAEVHLFPPMKQGGLESAVAVVAVEEGQTPPVVPEGEGRAPGAENRLAVYTAKYRLTLKGPDRGKWDFSIAAEADAPLVTVNDVVRGVQKRSGDLEDPARLTGDEFRAMVGSAEPSP